MCPRNGTNFLAVLISMMLNGSAFAVAIPIVDPGFDMYAAGTFTIVPDNRLLAVTSPGAGTGPMEDAPLISLDTFAAAGTADIPAGWTVVGERPGGSNNTARARCDTCFLGTPSGTVASINSFGADESPPTPGVFFQNLIGVSAQPNTLYTATIEVMDLNIQGKAGGLFAVDEIVVGDPGDPGDPTGTSRIRLNLSVGPTNLGGILSWSDITSGGLGTPESPISGGKALLTLTVLTGATVPEGDLTISFTSAGQMHPFPEGSILGGSAQTFFDNVTLDATPFSANPLGDFNNDGTVNVLDYIVYRMHDGDESGPLPNDDGLGTPISDDHYLLWRANYGQSLPGGGNALNAGAVPEPSTAFIMLTGAVLAVLRLRRDRQQ